MENHRGRNIFLTIELTDEQWRSSVRTQKRLIKNWITKKKKKTASQQQKKRNSLDDRLLLFSPLNSLPGSGVDWMNKYYHKSVTAERQKAGIWLGWEGEAVVASAIIENEHQLIIVLLSTRFHQNVCCLNKNTMEIVVHIEAETNDFIAGSCFPGLEGGRLNIDTLTQIKQKRL